MKHLATLSLGNEDSLLDIPFTTDEVSAAMKKLKRGKAPGPDNVMSEHLLEGGVAVIKWLTRIFNAIVSLEALPDSLKCGTIVPVYKGGGKDPLQPDSYRGITLSSVIAKVLETLLLNRLETILEEANIPHSNQSAYCKKVSCADAIFATQETIARYMGNGSRVFMCLYDLQKAFDSIEYPVLLNRLYAIGVNGRCWRLIRNWYDGALCRVKIKEGILSEPFAVERGVKQGSVLSPTLFLLIMDPLLISLQKSGVGLSVNDYYAGGFLHADDIRTLSTSIDSLEVQVSAVHDFARNNFLKLNFQKCEIIPFSCDASHSGIPTCKMDNTTLPVVATAKCLGYWWGRDLFATKSIEENVKKARRAFFSYGSMGAFQGDLNPLSSKSIIESCVMPILLFGCENWILSETCLHTLEAFLGELAKRALKWPQHFSNTSAILALEMETFRSRLICRKLSFLKRLLGVNAKGVGAVAMSSLVDDIDSVCLVKECRELESEYETSLTNSVLADADAVSERVIKKTIRGIDKEKIVEKCHKKSPAIANIINRGGCWPKLWDIALHLGSRHITGLRNLSRLIAHHGHGQQPCPLCSEQNLGISVIDHIMYVHHQELGLNFSSTEQMLTHLVEENIQFVYKFWKLFRFS